MHFAKGRIKAGLVGLMLGLLSQTSMAELVVVVSAKNPLAALNEHQVADIFLGRTSDFPSGGEAMPIDQAENSASRAEFYLKTTGKSPSQLKAYWSKLIFTGSGQPPREVSDAAEVKKALNAMLNSVGYIDRSELDSSVKVVLMLH